MKILNVNRFYYLRGGADRYFFDLAKILKNNGHEIIPFSTQHIHNVQSEYSNYFVAGYTEDDFNNCSLPEKIKIFCKGIYSLETKRKVARLIEYTRPDVAHLHGLFYQISLSVIDKLYEKGIPIVYSLHDYHTICGNSYLYYAGRECQECCKDKYLNIVLRRCYRNSFMPSLMAYITKLVHKQRKTLEKVTFFTVPHRYMRDIFVSWGFNKNKFKILLNPFIDNDIISFPQNNHRDYFIFYGRIIRSKGIFTILEAFQRMPDQKLKIFGRGPDLENVKRYINDNKMGNVFLNTELRWGPELQKIISESIAVISASEWPTPSEYLNYETIALGKPIIASDAIGNLDLVKDGENGYVFQQGNSDDLMKKVKFLLHQDIIAMGGKSREIYEDKININKFYWEMMFIYNEAIAVSKSN